MSKILAILPYTSKDGRPMLRVTTSERVHFPTRKQWTGKGNSEAFDAYVGGQFLSDYFKSGDELLSGDVVDADDVILRDFSAAMNPTVVAMIAAGLIAKKSEEANDAAALFAHKRASETPEQTAARRAAAAAARAARVVTPASPIEA